MTNKRPPLNVPSPRDHADPTLSELVPFRSSKIDLKKSPAVYFLLLLALSVPAMFPAASMIFSSKSDQEFMRNLMWFSAIITFVICATLQTMVFMYARTSRSFLHFWAPFLVVCAILMTPALNLFFFVFRELWPFWNPQAKGFVPAFLSMFSGAGLMEELLKAVPILYGAWLGVRARQNPTVPIRPGASFFIVRGPLDGALMGVFAGGAFTFLETGLQYVPNEMMRLFQGTRDTGISVAGAFLLLIPRALGAAVGHMAYSGIFGYFIGLAVIRPSAMTKLLLIGWLASSVIHALWNSVGQISFMLQYAIAGASAIGLASVLLKARQLEQALTGIAAESFGSIVVDRPPSPNRQAPPPPPHAAAPLPARPASVPQAAVEGQPLILDIGGLRLALRADAVIDPGVEPALRGQGVGVKGLVVAHPTRAGVLGLRNVGSAPWTARLRDGSEQQIAPEQNIRLAPGISIRFDGTLTGAVVAAG